MNYYKFLFITFIHFTYGFFNYNKFSIKDNEIKQKIYYKVTLPQQNILKNINGFFGNIGPHIKNKNISNMYDLFNGNGNIQSIFFNNGELTFVNHLVRTDKILYEEQNGIIPNNYLIKLIFFILAKMKLLPNIFGLANTKIFNINNKLYALYERDKPYLLNINFTLNKISTIRKLDEIKIDHFSAHSKFNNMIETIDYNLISKNVNYYQLDNNFTIIQNKEIKMEYIPIIHDFFVTEYNTIIIDSPLKFDYKNILNNSLPISLDNTKNSIIHILNKNTLLVEKYYTNESFFVFHYANYFETLNNIYIYASLYNKIDFTDVNVAGKYRRININKVSKKVIIEKNNKLENMSLDFPVKFKNKILFRNMLANEFIICKDLQIIKKINLNELTLCGEPVILFIKKHPYLLSFSYNDKNDLESFLLIINLSNYEIIKIPLNIRLHFGFHSIFIPKV